MNIYINIILYIKFKLLFKILLFKVLFFPGFASPTKNHYFADVVIVIGEGKEQKTRLDPKLCMCIALQKSQTFNSSWYCILLLQNNKAVQKFTKVYTDTLLGLIEGSCLFCLEDPGWSPAEPLCSRMFWLFGCAALNHSALAKLTHHLGLSCRPNLPVCHPMGLKPTHSPALLCIPIVLCCQNTSWN